MILVAVAFLIAAVGLILTSAQNPTGKNQKTVVDTDQGMLQPGSRYVLFLKRVDDDFDLLTGYELSNGKVTPLDSGTPKFSDYAGAEESYLIEQIEKLARPNAN